MSDKGQSNIMVVYNALLRAVGTINKLPTERKEWSDQQDMIRITTAIVAGDFPVAGQNITGRDALIVCKALAYAIVTEHEDKEDMKRLLDELAKGFLGTEFYMAGARSHVHGTFHDSTTLH